MKKFKRKLLITRHKRFQSELTALYDGMDKKYPGWRDGPKSDNIKKRLHDTARITTNNFFKTKEKIVMKKDFKDWPFICDSIIIKQTSKKWISCFINGTEYALNGSAATELNLKFAHDAGVAIKGKSISEFVEIGLAL